MKKWADIKREKMSPERVDRIRREAQAESVQMTLHEILEIVAEAHTKVYKIASAARSEVAHEAVEALGAVVSAIAVAAHGRPIGEPQPRQQPMSEPDERPLRELANAARERRKKEYPELHAREPAKQSRRLAAAIELREHMVEHVKRAKDQPESGRAHYLAYALVFWLFSRASRSPELTEGLDIGGDYMASVERVGRAYALLIERRKVDAEKLAEDGLAALGMPQAQARKLYKNARD